MLTENLDVVADRIQVHRCSRGRAPTGMDGTASTDTSVGGPMNLVSHHESLSGSSARSSQQGRNHPRYGLCYTQGANGSTGVCGIRSQPVDQRGEAARVQGGQSRCEQGPREPREHVS